MMNFGWIVALFLFSCSVNATHFLDDLFLDKMPPEYFEMLQRAPWQRTKNGSFHDDDGTTGEIGGPVKWGIKGNNNTNHTTFTHFNVRFSNHNCLSFIGSPLALGIPGSERQFDIPPNTIPPSEATHLVVLTVNNGTEQRFYHDDWTTYINNPGVNDSVILTDENGTAYYHSVSREMASWAKPMNPEPPNPRCFPFKDRTEVPTLNVRELQFQDFDGGTGEVKGVISWLAPDDLLGETLVEYVVYWTSENKAIFGDTEVVVHDPEGDAIATLAADGSEFEISLPMDTVYPANATHIVVFTKNGAGEQEHPVAIPIVDYEDRTDDYHFEVLVTETSASDGGEPVEITYSYEVEHKECMVIEHAAASEDIASLHVVVTASAVMPQQVVRPVDGLMVMGRKHEADGTESFRIPCFVSRDGAAATASWEFSSAREADEAGAAFATPVDDRQDQDTPGCGFGLHSDIFVRNSTHHYWLQTGTSEVVNVEADAVSPIVSPHLVNTQDWLRGDYDSFNICRSFHNLESLGLHTAFPGLIFLIV